MKSRPFEGQVAAITGAASGIGRASAEALLAGGARVVLVDRDAAGLAAMQAEHGDAVIPLQLDLLDAAQCRTLVPQVLARAGRLDILHANAGLYIPGDVADDERARRLGVDRGHAANIPARRDGVVTHDRLPDPGGPTQHLVGSIQEMLRCDVERVGDRLGVRCCNSYDLSDPPVTISTCNRNRTGWGWRS